MCSKYCVGYIDDLWLQKPQNIQTYVYRLKILKTYTQNMHLKLIFNDFC